jgi:hypothetical protein
VFQSGLHHRTGLTDSSVAVYKKIRRLEEELEALGGTTGDETVRSTVIKTPNLTPRKVGFAISMTVKWHPLCTTIVECLVRVE